MRGLLLGGGGMEHGAWSMGRLRNCWKGIESFKLRFGE